MWCRNCIQLFEKRYLISHPVYKEICRNVCFCVTVMLCVHWPQDGMNLSAPQPRVSVCHCDRVRELFQHPLVSRCCCQHALTACYPPRTFSQCTPHTHAHTRRQWEGCGPREPWLPHNYYPPSLKLLPLWERGRGEGQRTRVWPLPCFTLCVWVYVFIWLASRRISGLC